ncbi:MAG: preprotein translocase subunit YajC [Oligoflexia bacterium]|nr:preprotein translocase subunit YajC [Oligoflexia bacterium]
MVFPIAAMFVIFYFLIIRPQGKKQKEHQKLLEGIKRGDQVITSGGILGEVAGTTDRVVTLQIADNVRIRILKSQIAGLAKEGNP